MAGPVTVSGATLLRYDSWIPAKVDIVFNLDGDQIATAVHQRFGMIDSV